MKTRALYFLVSLILVSCASKNPVKREVSSENFDTRYFYKCILSSEYRKNPNPSDWTKEWKNLVYFRKLDEGIVDFYYYKNGMNEKYELFGNSMPFSHAEDYYSQSSDIEITKQSDHNITDQSEDGKINFSGKDVPSQKSFSFRSIDGSEKYDNGESIKDIDGKKHLNSFGAILLIEDEKHLKFSCSAFAR